MKVRFTKDTKPIDGPISRFKINWNTVPRRLIRQFKEQGFTTEHFDIPSVKLLLLLYLAENGYDI